MRGCYSAECASGGNFACRASCDGFNQRLNETMVQDASTPAFAAPCWNPAIYTIAAQLTKDAGNGRHCVDSA